MNYGMRWWWYEEDPPLPADTGFWGARAVLQPDEGWGAILIIEASSMTGSIMQTIMVPLIREAILAGGQS